MAEILNAHGSKNDIFVAAMTPHDFASGDDLRGFVRRLCDRGGPFGADGVLLLRRGPGRRAGLVLQPGRLVRGVLRERHALPGPGHPGPARRRRRGDRQRRGAVHGPPRGQHRRGRPSDQPRASRGRIRSEDPRGGRPQPADAGPPARARPGTGVHRRHHRQPPPGRRHRQVRRVRADRDGGAGGHPRGRVPGRGEPVGVAPARARRGLRPDVRARRRAHRLVRLRDGRLPRRLLPHRPDRSRAQGRRPQCRRDGHGLAAGAPGTAPPGPLAPGPGGQRHVRLPRRDRPVRPDPGQSAAREPYEEEVRAYAALDQRNAARLRAAGVETAALAQIR